jgi:hypothetical protein
MTEICRLIIPVDANEMNPNRRRRLRDWISTKTRHRNAAYATWLVADRPRSASPVTVSVTIRRGRRLDEDNARASLKAVFDGLFKHAITPDDSPRWVKLGTLTQEIAARWKLKPEIEIVVEELCQEK